MIFSSNEYFVIKNGFVILPAIGQKDCSIEKWEQVTVSHTPSFTSRAVSFIFAAWKQGLPVFESSMLDFLIFVWMQLQR